MLSINDVPEELEANYTDYKNLSRALYYKLRHCGKHATVPADTDLFSFDAHGSVVYIVEGFFKLTEAGKTVRLFSEGDFVIIDNFNQRHTLASDFACDIVLFDHQVFLSALKEEANLAAWLELRDLENRIHLSLCAFNLADDIDATFRSKQYQQGEVIMEQGAMPDEIFEMISGSATVLRDGQQVGTVNTGEIFGEIGFLTGDVRTGTVVAAHNCFVRIVQKDDFNKLMEINPQMLLSISKTLAARITTLNEQIVRRLRKPVARGWAPLDLLKGAA